MGQPSKNDPGALVICLLLKTWLCKPYRDLVSFLSDNMYLWPIIELKVLPGRMDVWRAMNKNGHRRYQGLDIHRPYNRRGERNLSAH